MYGHPRLAPVIFSAHTYSQPTVIPSKMPSPLTYRVSNKSPRSSLLSLVFRFQHDALRVQLPNTVDNSPSLCDAIFGRNFASSSWKTGRWNSKTVTFLPRTFLTPAL